MELIEIRNNLIKLSYNEYERPTLGQFVALTGDDKSYVAQYVNLKADDINNFAVAKLMFAFNKDGVVSEYDGSTPSIKDNIVQLPANELLSLLPVETPIKIGQISGCQDFFDVDISIFEHNFTVFCENDFDKSTLISNCVRQLFRLKEKSIIIDTCSMFEDYPKLVLGRDYRLPLNSDFIDFIFDYELKEVDVPTKAVIQDIFSAVQQYIRTLDDEFISIESFIDVVTSQYKETQMPELALLKNKLLKYKDSNIFANDLNDFKCFEEKLKEKNCVVIDLKNVADELQKEIITYVHKIVESFDKYVYYFVCLNDFNSDKRLLKRLINHNHVFTTILASHNYKYASELKTHAQNLMFFAPQTMQHDFLAYNTFLNKLNQSEGVIYGRLTQGIPLIISLEDLELDLTKEDVFGDRLRFVPAIEEDALSSEDIYAINNLQESPELSVSNLSTKNTYKNDAISPLSSQVEEDDTVEVLNSSSIAEINDQNDEIVTQNDEYTNSNSNPNNQSPSLNKEEQIENILDNGDDTELSAEDVPEQVENDEEIQVNQSIDVTDESYLNSEQEDELSFMDEFTSEGGESTENIASDSDELDAELTEDDLDLMETESEYQENISPVVPVYDTEEEEISDDTVGFKSGDRINHPRYGHGVVEKIIKYGNKTLCSIDFENVGRRLLDPSVSDFEKI